VLYQLSYRPIDLYGRGVYYQRIARSVNKKRALDGAQASGPGSGNSAVNEAYRFFAAFWKGFSRMMVSSLRAPVEMMAGLTPQSLQSFST
jgi:hypothetical protein